MKYHTQKPIYQFHNQIMYQKKGPASCKIRPGLNSVKYYSSNNLNNNLNNNLTKSNNKSKMQLNEYF